MAEDLTPIGDVEFEEYEDDPNWAFRYGGDSTNLKHEIQGRHEFCGATFSITFSDKEIRKIPDLDALVGEAADTILQKHTPCPVLAARVTQITIG